MPDAGKTVHSLTQSRTSRTSKDLKRNIRVCNMLWLQEPGGGGEESPVSLTIQLWFFFNSLLSIWWCCIPRALKQGQGALCDKRHSYMWMFSICLWKRISLIFYWEWWWWYTVKYSVNVHRLGCDVSYRRAWVPALPFISQVTSVHVPNFSEA